jgi:cytochrome c peroxidase
MFILIVAEIAPMAAAQKKTAAPPPAPLTDIETLGKKLFNDTTLSQPNGQSCASCHSPKFAFTDPDQSEPTSAGVLPKRFGFRNAPTVSYATFSPVMQYNPEEVSYQGGLFWDGRATNLTDQALQPFLNPLEMHDKDETQVIKAVRAANYAPLFLKVFGKDALKKANIDTAYAQVATAIAAYEGTAEVNPFSSKFDAYLAGTAELTAKETLGMNLFNGKANCSTCHISEVGAFAAAPLFTDFTYENIGVPKNWNNPYLYLPPDLNPDGVNFIDVGLGNTLAPLGVTGEDGKFKIPTLRNVALTAPYGHNGYFTSLKEIVHFYNTRDVPSAGFPPAEVPETENLVDLGNLGLTDAEEDAIVAFLETLTDGYTP